MNYIYDILVNFNKELYDFYDWNKNDNIKHLKKIPIFKIGSNKLYDIKNNIVEFDKEFLSRIENKTEEFSNRKTKNIKYACIFTDGLDTLVVNIRGELYYSTLLIDEEIEILNMSNRLELTNISYIILNNNSKNFFKTRNQLELENYIKREFKKIADEKNIDELKYLYYECFNNKSNSLELNQN